MAKYLDENGLVYVWGKIKGITDTKVAKEDGKGLSTNDFDDSAKTKLANLPANATVVSASSVLKSGTKIGSITINGTETDLYCETNTNTTYSNATTAKDGLMSSTDKSKLDSFGTADSYALKTDIANAYIYKGSVDAISNLPTDGNREGDVYDVKSNGKNYAWNGKDWDDLGGTFSIDRLSNTDIDGICK